MPVSELDQARIVELLVQDLRSTVGTGHEHLVENNAKRLREFIDDVSSYIQRVVDDTQQDMHDEFIGPRFLTYAAALEMNPIDAADRVPALRSSHGIGYCNITRCCTKVCPEHITITENAIIPLKERVVDRFYDPITKLLRVFRT